MESSPTGYEAENKRTERTHVNNVTNFPTSWFIIRLRLL